MPTLYIEKPMDKYGNTWYPKCVIEAQEVEPGNLKVLAPDQIRRMWPYITQSTFVECEGPAEVLIVDVDGWRERLKTVRNENPNKP